MATLYYDNYYNAYVKSVPENAPVNETGGRVRVLSATLTSTTVLTSAGVADATPGDASDAADVIYLGKIPAKSKIHLVAIKTSADWGDSVTFALNTIVGTTTTAILAAGVLTTADVVVFGTGTANGSIENIGTETSGEAIIALAFAGDADITLTASNIIEITVFYSYD